MGRRKVSLDCSHTLSVSVRPGHEGLLRSGATRGLLPVSPSVFPSVPKIPDPKGYTPSHRHKKVRRESGPEETVTQNFW